MGQKSDPLILFVFMFVRRQNLEPLFPSGILLLFKPRKKTAVQQAERIHIQKLVFYGNKPKIGNLNHRPNPAF
ncbi:hypothetical protein Hanom_Chr01g00090261 [Helianthus anomalus]